MIDPLSIHWLAFGKGNPALSASDLSGHLSHCVWTKQTDYINLHSREMCHFLAQRTGCPLHADFLPHWQRKVWNVAVVSRFQERDRKIGGGRERGRREEKGACTSNCLLFSLLSLKLKSAITEAVKISKFPVVICYYCYNQSFIWNKWAAYDCCSERWP